MSLVKLFYCFRVLFFLGHTVSQAAVRQDLDIAVLDAIDHKPVEVKLAWKGWGQRTFKEEGVDRNLLRLQVVSEQIDRVDTTSFFKNFRMNEKTNGRLKKKRIFQVIMIGGVISVFDQKVQPWKISRCLKEPP